MVVLVSACLLPERDPHWVGTGPSHPRLGRPHGEWGTCSDGLIVPPLLARPCLLMDLLAIARYYVDRMLTEVSGMKALLLDAETTQSISGVYSQTDIMNQEVYLVEKLEANKTDKLPHLKVCVFVFFGGGKWCQSATLHPALAGCRKGCLDM